MIKVSNSNLKPSKSPKLTILPNNEPDYQANDPNWHTNVDFV